MGGGVISESEGVWVWVWVGVVASVCGREFPYCNLPWGLNIKTLLFIFSNLSVYLLCLVAKSFQQTSMQRKVSV